MSSQSSDPAPDRAPDPATPSPAGRAVRPRWRRLLAGLGITLGVGAVVLAAGLGGAEYYTSRPDFCGSCHVMDAYYESWSQDVHGAKHGILCIDCHYAPGERLTIKAKFKGLSQVASYFSGRYGAGRPRAHVSDESCLRSGCHGDQAFVPALLLIGEPRTETRLVEGREVEVQRAPSVHFVHQKHMEVAARTQEIEHDVAQTRARLATQVDAEMLGKIVAIATSVDFAADRTRAMRELVERLPVSVQEDAHALMQQEHYRIRVAQLAGLNCSACHSFNPTRASHITIDREVCYTCHFTHEVFNRETGECLRCHEPPTRAITVHATGSGAGPGSVVMDHQDIVKKGVDCASCHLDVVGDDGPVSERECVHCHDQAHYLSDFPTRTTETVRKYHEVHIAEQRAHCFDCHTKLRHGLLEPAAGLARSSGFLLPVLNECQHCHPNHHSEQVELLTGTGGVGIENALPNAMVGSRLNCRACHTQPAAGDKGEQVVRATQASCIACHSDDYLKLFDQWKHEIETYLGETQTLFQQVDGLVGRAGPSAPPDARTCLDAARQNIALVRDGGGLHNRQYALLLLDAARRDLNRARELLSPVTPQEQ